MPEIAVVMPVFIENERQYEWFIEAVHSVYGQRYRNYELIVVFDQSPVIIQAKDMPIQMKVIRMAQRGGPGAARNAGIKAAESPWILCLDADDRLKPDALEMMRRYANPAYWVYGDLELIGAEQGIRKMNDFNFQELRAVVGPSGTTALYHRSVWEKLGGYRPDLDGFEDIEFWIRCAEQGVYGLHIKEVVLEYRQHPDSRMAKLTGKRQAIRDEIFQNHRKFFDNLEGVNNMLPANKPSRVKLKYMGHCTASFYTATSQQTGERYFVDGRGAYVDVNPIDVPWLLGFASGAMAGFETPMPEPPAMPQILLTPVGDTPISGAPVLAPEFTDILALDEAAAIAAINGTSHLPDLMVHQAMEESNDPPRPGVLAAIETRITYLENVAAGHIQATAPAPAAVEAVETGGDITKMSAKNAIKLVKAQYDTLVLMKLATREETNVPPRQSVLDAIERRIGELEDIAAGKVLGSDGEPLDPDDANPATHDDDLMDDAGLNKLL